MEIKFSPQSDDDNYNNTTTDYQEPSDTFNSVVVDDRNNGGFSDDSYQSPYSAPQQDRYSGQYVPNQQDFSTSGQTNPQYNQPYSNPQYNQQYGNQQYQQPYGNSQQYGNQQFNQPYGNQQQYQQQPFQQTQTKFCRHCGGVIPADAVVCTKCGRQVEQISQNPNGQNVVINNINNNNNGGFYTNEPVSPKNQGIALVLAACGFVGLGGLHRFYSGKIGSGLLWFFTYGFFGIGTIVDLIHIAQGKFRDSNGLPIKK